MTDFSKRFARQLRFLQDRLSAEGCAGLHLTVGILVVLLAGYWFGEIAERHSPNDVLVLMDQHLALWFNQHATPAITWAATAITFLGSVAWITTASFFLIVFFIRRRDRLNAFLVAMPMLGGSLLNVLLKHYFHRQRPVLENPLVTLSSCGFPVATPWARPCSTGFLLCLHGGF